MAMSRKYGEGELEIDIEKKREKRKVENKRLVLRRKEKGGRKKIRE